MPSFNALAGICAFWTQADKDYLRATREASFNALAGICAFWTQYSQ